MTIDPTPTPATEEMVAAPATAEQASDAPVEATPAAPTLETADVANIVPTDVTYNAGGATSDPVDDPAFTPETPAEVPVEAPAPTPEPELAPVTEPTPEPAPVQAAAAPAQAPYRAPAPVEEPLEIAPLPTAAEAQANLEASLSVAEPEAPVASRDAQADKDLFEQYMAGLTDDKSPDAPDAGFKRLNKGDLVDAVVSSIERTQIFLQVPGSKMDAVLPVSELSGADEEVAKAALKVGDTIRVVVVKAQGGAPEVSQKKAEFEAAWEKVEAAYESQETLKAQVIERVKGGLVVDIGVRGFVPATHVGSGKLRNIEKYVGEELDLKVIEIDRDRKKVVLSNRQAEDERRAAAKDTIFTQVKAGDKLKGTVRRLADYGAFVDLGGVDGLLHISEMSWARITHPKEMFKEGQEIEVMVLRLDESAGKISLGHRQVLPDPWNLIRENYKNGQKLTVNIGRIVQGGAFIKLPEGAEAFMPVSEMSPRRIKSPKDVVEEGQDVECQIIDLRPDERRMVLSMKAVGGGLELRPGATEAGSGYEEDMRRADRSSRPMPGTFRPTEEKPRGGRGGGAPATGGATIGERLGALRGLLGGAATAAPDEDAKDES